MTPFVENLVATFGRKAIGVAAILAMLLVIPYLACNLIEVVEAGNIAVIQSPWDGSLTVHTEPGPKWQGFGTVTLYPRTGLFEFIQPVNPYSEDKAEAARYDKAKDNSHKITFNDGGEAYISGSIRYDYPMDKEKIVMLHRMFYGHDAVIRGLVAKTVERSVYMSGPLMTSIDSFMSRRSDLPILIEDQARNGLYRVVTKEVVLIDEFTKERKQIKQAEPVADPDSPNGLLRQDESIMAKYGLSLANLSITVNYDPKVQGRVNALFAAASDIQIATMNAKKAEQDRKTAAEQGQATATTAEWRAKAIAAEEIARAEKEKRVQILSAEKERESAIIAADQALQVAELDKKTAIAYKDAQLQRAEGDATYKRKIMEADGALGIRAETYLKTQELWATAFGSFRGNLVPQMVMGGSGGQGSSAQDFMNMMMMKTAKDLFGDPNGLLPRQK